VLDAIAGALGLGQDTIGVLDTALRALVTYAVALAFVRIGDKRFLGKSTAFDIVIGIMFGSIMSRAITDPEDFVPIVVAGGVLIAAHFLVALVTSRSDRVGTLVKGQERVLVRDGQIQEDQMAAAHLTERDLRAALRTEGKVEDVASVRVATLERSGDISVIPRDPPS
jgi:uncharacterized membrane protein YcaP (DUF421 family)